MTTLLPIALGLLLQSTALLLLGLLALRLALRRGPAVQSLIGRATLAGVGLALLLAAPLTGRVRPLWHVTLPASPPAPNNGGVATPPPGAATLPRRESKELGPKHYGVAPAEMTEGKGAAQGKGAASSASTPPLSTSSPSRLGRIAAPGGGVGSPLAALWGLGTALLLLWLGVCQRHLTRLRREASSVTSGPAAEMLLALTPQPPVLLAHPSVRSPFLAGLWHPGIFLPAAYATDFDPTALRAILAHELAHLARRDNAWTLAARLLCALLWPQPLLWVLCRRLEQISEEACDQAVLAHDCPPRAYADCLLTLAERHPLGRRERALGAGVAPFRSSLGQRIGRILDKGTHAMSTVTPRLRLTIAALTVAAALGGMFLVSSAPAQSPGPGTAALTPEQQNSNLTRMQDAKNLRDIGIALTLYTQDHDEFFPDAAHWMDELSPYLKDKTVFFDPFQPGARHYGYAFNRNCSGKSLAAFAHPWETIAVFDSTLGTRNASNTGQSLRGAAEGTTRGSNYLLVDGHVKHLLKAERPSFAIKWDRRFIHMTPVHRSAGLPARLSHPPRIISEEGMASRRNFLTTLAASHPNPELSQARFLAGLTPVQGPGVVVTLNDSKKAPKIVMPSGMTPPNIIHDTDINQVVNELKAAGAEAIAVNDQRLVATSSVRVAGPTVLINFIPVVPPFAIEAIGNPKTLAGAMNIPGGIATQLKAYDPAMFSVREAENLTLPAYSGGSEPRFARPVSEMVNPARARMLKELTKLRAASELKLKGRRESLARYEQAFEDELHLALPQSDAQTQTKAGDLERNIGELNLSLKTIREIAFQHPERQEDHRLEMQRQAELKPLLAEEARLSPATAQSQQHLARVHVLAMQCNIRTTEIMTNRMELSMLNQAVYQQH